MNCDSCRARMCTDGLLSKVRCAECRQIKLAQLREFAAKASLLALGGFFVWDVFFRCPNAKTPAYGRPRPPADLTPARNAIRRRA